MQTIIAFIVCALITVSSGTIQQNTFIKTGESVGMEFPNVPVVPGVRSRLQCAALCDQHSWCIAILWNQNKKTCQELTRVLIPQTMPSGLYRAMFREDGYTYMTGMVVKYVDIILPWQGARDYCVNEGGRLVVIDTQEKYNVITTSSNIQAHANWWVGATKAGGTWTWTTGQNVDSNVREDGDGSCLDFFNVELVDAPCTIAVRFICEK